MGGETKEGEKRRGGDEVREGRRDEDTKGRRDGGELRIPSWEGKGVG